MTRFAQQTWRKVAVDLKPNVGDSSLWLGWLLSRPVNGSVLDASGAGRNGAIRQVSSMEHILGRGYISNKVNGPKHISTTPSSYNPPGSCTITCWFAPELTGALRWIANFFDDLSNGWGLANTDNSISIYNDLSNAGANLYSTIVPVGKPVFVVGTIDGATLEQKLYIDGHLVGSGTVAASALSAITAEFSIIDRVAGAGVPTKGRIWYPQVFSEVKDQAWVTQEYQKGARAIQFATDWGHKADGIARGGGDTIGDGPFRIMVGDGTSPACTTSSIAGQTVKTVKDTAGLGSRIYAKWSEFGVHSSETGYGSWCGWFYIPTGYAYVRWGLFWADSDIGGGGAGWRIDIANGFGIRLFRGGVGPVLTIPTVPLDQWFHLHVTRRYDGFWEIFVNGLSVGSITNNAVISGPYTGLESASIGSMVSLSDAHGGHAITKYLGVVPPNLG